MALAITALAAAFSALGILVALFGPIPAVASALTFIAICALNAHRIVSAGRSSHPDPAGSARR